ncbi:MAG: 2-oxo acid dehydrogenase subunit E2 [Acidobacteria bacterium]|nr:2-oxo acid dehydrogenase subunit E2 [Acidobacteriota bacterium]
MPTPIVMPQMGESIAEGTIVRWIKKVGDQVDQDEPLFEISTDKVDAEIPSPAAGVLTEIMAKEGETVAVNSIVGTIGQAGESPAPSAPQAQPQAEATPARSAGRPGGREAAATPASQEDLRRQKSSPLVRRIARDNHVDIGQIAGSGIGGRVTKEDIVEFLGKTDSEPGTPKTNQERGTRNVEQPVPAVPSSSGRVDIQPLSVMRKKIAEHMVMSQRTSAHVHSVFHVNFSTVEKIRQQKRSEYEQLGAKLTYMSFIARVVVEVIRRHPVINASLDGDNILYKKDVNLGIAVALESGLIVPVIRNADEKNMLGLSRAIADVADRARAKQLKPDDVQGGTFTITNPGQFGAQFGMPIISQPQVAILGVGTIEKRPVVVEDAIAIRTMAYLTLGYDHRLVDGAVADQFMSDVKKGIEHFDPSQV